jgi:starvation-inducible DNA-binding protein
MSRPPTDDEAQVIQKFGSLRAVRLGLSAEARHQSVSALNRLLAHSMALRDLYKKAHWQVSGGTFYELHLMFDAHYGEQLKVVDAVAERVQTLGGVSLATARDLVSESRLARAPRGREAAVDQLSGLIAAHEFLLEEERPLARAAATCGDEGTNDLIVGEVVRTSERQAWFVGEHLLAREADSGPLESPIQTEDLTTGEIA